MCVSVFLSHRRDNVGQCMCMTLPVIILFHPMPSVWSRLPANWKGNERSGVLRTLSNSLTRQPSSAQGPNWAIFFTVCRLTSLKYVEHDFFFFKCNPSLSCHPHPSPTFSHCTNAYTLSPSISCSFHILRTDLFKMCRTRCWACFQLGHNKILQFWDFRHSSPWPPAFPGNRMLILALRLVTSTECGLPASPRLVTSIARWWPSLDFQSAVYRKEAYQGDTYVVIKKKSKKKKIWLTDLDTRRSTADMTMSK